MEESMDSETRILGQQLAREVAARAKAREILEARAHAFSWWQLLLTCVAAGICAVLAGRTLSIATTAAVAVALVAFLLAVAALLECVRLRRRFDAAMVLLAPAANGSPRRTGGKTPPAA